MRIISSFKHRNFRLYFLGQAASLLGVWMQGTAVSWLVWRLTGSPKWLGAIGFATQIPVLIFGLFAGVVADRIARYRLVVIIQTIAMFQAGILAALTLSGHIDAWTIFVLSLFLGVIFSFDYPIRVTFLMDMVGREDITNAVAINASVIHGARVLGPMAAGFIVERWGEGTCVAVNCISFLFVLAALLLMKREEFYPQTVDLEGTVFSQIGSAFKSAWKIPQIKRPIISVFILSLFGMPYVFLLPHIISERFQGGAGHLGVSMSSAGIGALIGAIYLALRKGIAGFYPVIRLSVGMTGVGLVIYSFIPTFVTSLPPLVLIGVATFFVVAGAHTILQIESPPALRGRIMSILTIAFFGTVPIGSLLFGCVASFIGVECTIAAGGAVCIIFMAIDILRRP